MSEAFEKIRDRINDNGLKIEKNRQNHFMAQCPAHDDNNPSLGVDDKGDHVLLRCYAGCDNERVVEALDITMADLFDGDLTKTADLKQVPRVPQKTYVYEAANGEPWLLVDRYYPKTFIQRLPGTEVGDRSGINGKPTILYRLPKLKRAMNAGDAVVWLVEGEKDVEACEKQGLLATTAPGGAGARWQDAYSQFLRQAKEVVIVVDQDTIKPDGTLGVGQQHALAAREGLRAQGVKVRLVAPAAGKDATDHFAAGYGPGDFVPEPTAYTRTRGVQADKLMTMEFAPIRWAIKDILPAGLTIFAASPKVGKSWCSLDMCMAVASGGRALGGLEVEQGSALYLAREDTDRRLQSRMRLLDPEHGTAPGKLELISNDRPWPGGIQGLAMMTEWAEEAGDPALVILDTLQKVEPDMGEEASKGNSYSKNYTMMSRYKEWADKHNCAVVVVHHDRKGAPSSKNGDTTSDPFQRISGTQGLTGSADTLWFLDCERGAHEGILYATGRDIVEQELPMKRYGPLWQATDRPSSI